MTPAAAVITLSSRDGLIKVPELITATGHTGFPVIDDGRLVGIITNRDARTIHGTERLRPSVQDAMTPAPVVIYPEDSLEEALEIMVSRDFNHLPVVEKDSPERLAGFLTRTDILKTYSRSTHPDDKSGL
jgi:CIC family chloride channel protein